MEIREGTPEDGEELQGLQANCPQGTSLVVSTVNRPDFFGRAKAYESWRVWVACHEGKITGSTALAIRELMVNGFAALVGYSFQTFVSPAHRGAGIGSALLDQAAWYAKQQGVVLVYGLVMEDNVPSMRLVEKSGFRLRRTLAMAGLPVYRRMVAPGEVRQATSDDLELVSALFNETWQGFQLAERSSPSSLADQLGRVDGLDNLAVLEDRGELLAALGFLDWAGVSRLEVVRLSPSLRATSLLLDALRWFRPLPHGIKTGQELKLVMLSPVAFREPEQLAVLLRHLNNRLLPLGIEQIFCVCERNHALLRAAKGFVRIDTSMQLYVKHLQPGISLAEGPVFVDGIDI